MTNDIHAFIINLDSAVERWSHVETSFRRTGIPFTRVPAVNGRELQLPLADYCERRYRIYHGRRTSMAEIGCYLSHIKCLKAFLASPHDFAVICEDDIQPKKDLTEVLDAVIGFSHTWDILRLCGFHHAHPVPYARLPNGYSLSVTFTRLCGSGAYMVNRRVAEVLIRELLPMRLPFDHALDREWVYGLRAASLTPLPIDQKENEFESQIDRVHRYRKFPWYRRYLTVFPYQFFNETTRVASRFQQLLRAKRLARQ